MLSDDLPDVPVLQALALVVASSSAGSLELDRALWSAIVPGCRPKPALGYPPSAGEPALSGGADHRGRPCSTRRVTGFGRLASLSRSAGDLRAEIRARDGVIDVRNGTIRVTIGSGREVGAGEVVWWRPLGDPDAPLALLTAFLLALIDQSTRSTVAPA